MSAQSAFPKNVICMLIFICACVKLESGHEDEYNSLEAGLHAELYGAWGLLVRGEIYG